MHAPTRSPDEVVSFWRDAGPSRWFRKDDDFDRDFTTRFLALHESAARGELDAWAASPAGSLALCILLDQFPRNAFRGTPRMYATDARARDIALAAIDAGLHLQVEPALRQFFHLPLMHSESARDQARCVELASPDAESHRWSLHHRDIIRRFGRFPHRNAVMGRESTPEELSFLAEGGFAPD